MPARPKLCPHGVLGIEKCKECKKEYNASYKLNPESKKKQAVRSRAYSRRKRGIPEMGGESPVGTCPICNDHCTLVPDHDHRTGALRDWICGRCNKALGVYEAYRPLVQTLEEYLSRSR